MLILRVACTGLAGTLRGISSIRSVLSASQTYLITVRFRFGIQGVRKIELWQGSITNMMSHYSDERDGNKSRCCFHSHYPRTSVSCLAGLAGLAHASVICQASYLGSTFHRNTYLGSLAPTCWDVSGSLWRSGNIIHQWARIWKARNTQLGI